jgi:predicted HTH domain antitoxin
MALTIPDDVIEQLRTVAPEVLIELACRLYTADKISKPEATRLAGIPRVDFEGELTRRGLPWIRITGDDYLEQEFRDLKPSADRVGENLR